MTRATHRVHQHAYEYGNSADPWPGDIAKGWPLMAVYRFDGQVWRALQRQSAERSEK